MDILLGPVFKFFLEEYISLQDLSNMWFQYDGTPSHNSLKSHTVLTSIFENNIIRYGGPIEWPPILQDLNH